MTHLIVRRAMLEDADAAVAVLRGSITKLCVADHKNDAKTLDAWLQNKTVEQFRVWVLDPNRYVVVAEHDSVVVGVAAIHASGQILLCYVRPGLQRVGVGGAMLAALEGHAATMGIAKLQLVSSSEARAFYERSGYVGAGPATPGFGLTMCFPYEKALR